MTKKRLNWRNILNALMGSVSLVLVALIISMGFIAPKKDNTVKALNKQNIVETYNVSFVSAKTKYRTANAYEIANPDSDDFTTYKDGKSYLYNYSTSSGELYKETTTNNEYSSEYGMTSIQTADGDEIKQYVKVTSSYPHIPATATHFKNASTNNLEKIYYDAFDNEDFVILDGNYTIPNVGENSDFNVENVYISIGDLDDTVKLTKVQVTGTLHNATGLHYLDLNSEKRYGDNTENPPYSVWYQYFDVHNTYATETAEKTSPKYKIADASGLYTLTFSFMRQLEDGKVTQEESFEYSFYLLDSADYSEYPVIKNATLGSTLENETNEYFYHFECENPSIIYSPDRFNLSYKRQNNEIVDEITTEFSTETYTVDGINQQYGKITFYNNDEYLKDVYIFTNYIYSSDKTVCEYIYASANQSLNYDDLANYEQINTLLENDTLDYEYKMVKILTKAISGTNATFTTKTYYTTEYSLCSFVKLDFNPDKYNKFVDDIVDTATQVTDNGNISYTYSTAGKTTTQLKRMLSIDTIDLNYTYMLSFDDLGVYDFSYTYVAQWFNNDNSIEKTIYTSSSSIVPKDYTLTYTQTGEPETKTETKNLNIVISGYLNEQNSVNLLNYTFSYNKNATYPLSDGKGNGFNFGTNYQLKIGGLDLSNITFSLETEDARLKLVMTIPVGKITTGTTTTLYETSPLNNNKQITKTTYDYSLTEIGSSNISTDTNELSYLRSILVNIETQDSMVSEGSDEHFYPIETVTYKTHTLGKDKLTIFGSITYFSKVNSTTDSGYSKLEQVDSKENKNFISDYTARYVAKNGGNGLLATAPTYGFSKNLGLTLDNIIITDTQVFWKNYSSLLYGTGDNSKISQSKIYRYTNYKTQNGDLDLDNAQMSEYSNKNTYFKDIYVKDDGYYEVIIKYTYNFYKENSLLSNTTTFYQLFVFVIDNSSPSLTFETETLDTDNNTVYTNLLPNSYTNKVVRISWPVPTYFKNNIYIEVTKTNFAGNTSDMPFVAKFDGETGIVISSGSEAYIKGISSFEKSADKSTYYVTFKLPTNNTDWNLDGHYSVTLYYGPENIDGTKPNLTQKYTSDNKAISGMSVLPVTKNDDGAYVVNYDLMSTLKENAQILNTDFTFRYDPKASGASITTYFHKISLDVITDYNKLITCTDGKTGITTNYCVNGDDESINKGAGTPYNYNYDTGNSINNANFLSCNSSCIYLFKMKDEAGNEARYVVFYDTTTPRFLVSPAPTGSNNIVSDVTSITWGDYKAIKISGLTASDTLIDNMNDYTESSDGNRLVETLSYIKNLSDYGTFNNTKVEKVNNAYYLLVPIVKAQITDEDNNNNVVTDTTKYYLFPTSPLSDENKINLPTHNADGSVVMEDEKIKLTSFGYSKIETVTSYDYFGDASRVYIYATLTDNNIIVRGVDGTGLYYYTIYDELGNSNMGDLWMNLDKTQTLAYATFNYSDNLSKATGLTGESASSYSAAKLYISSLENSNQDSVVIPKYSITYSYFAYDADFYNNYQIASVQYITSDTEGDKTTYLEFTFKSLADTTIEVTRRMQIYDRLGNRVQPVSYPYSMESSSSENDETKSIYINTGYSSTTEKVDENIKRVYSNVVNSTKNTSNGQTVTKEGLYIFKREYDKSVEDTTLGNDSRIIYRVYYIDRSGIISYIPTSSSVANALYGTGNDIDFLLGSTYSDTALQKEISATNIYNNQTSSASNNASNTEYTSYDLFSTNKVQTTFSLTLDKFNYKKFINNNGALLDAYAEESNIKSALNTYLFNEDLFTSLFKLDLTLNKGTNGAKIIDETNMDTSQRYNSTLMSKYISEYKNNTNITSRGNQLSFFYGDTLNSYYITLNDQSGHIERTYNETSGLYETTSTNAGSNSLAMSFKIKHVIPSGDFYGKYYGDPSISYDENESNSQLPSIPVANDGTYLLISKYLNDSKGSLKHLSSTQNILTTADGSTVTVASTNNETLVFLFAITNDDYMAQIDTNNIQVYQNGISASNLLFNRYEQNGTVFNYTTALVPSQEKQDGSFICNVIDGVTYYAIIIFDNNLGEILDEDEASFNNHRLLDEDNNPSEATYYICIHYVGSENDYDAELNGETVSYYSSTYKIDVDRIKPTYNLVRLMELDKYTYTGNASATKVDETNYREKFDAYSSYYNFNYDEDTKFYNSDLENYFFAVDARESTSFVFKSIDKKDSNGGFYIRPLGTDISNYKFSYTPDDYTIYNNAELRGDHNQFMPEDKINILFNGTTRYSPTSFEIGNYYYCTYIDGEMSVNLMLNQGIVEANNYYEIIEWDEAQNYRVYGIYIHDATNDSVSYQYQTYNGNNYNTNTLNYSNSVALVSGISFSLLKNGVTDFAYITNDLFIRAEIKITSNNINETLYLYHIPYENILRLTDSNNNVIKEISTNDTLYKSDFVSQINSIIADYKSRVSDTYGYTIEISIIDRLGIPATYDRTILNDYVITYSVAGNELKPTFATSSNGTTFIITIPAQQGSTYITSVEASEFNQTWIGKDIDYRGTQFRQHVNELKKGVKFELGTGVYRFIIQDNFGRSSTYFYEFGISSSSTGGSIKYFGNHSSYSDGFNYTYNNFAYSFDSKTYKVFIRYTGENMDTDEFVSGEEIYGPNSIYSIEDLSRFGISSIITTGNITEITFQGVKGNRYVSKYEIKAILASTADGYNWGDEENNSNIFVYDNKVAIQKAIQQVSVRNLKGIDLDTSTNLYLTDDFQLVLEWGTIPSADRIDFNAQIELTRTYEENGVSKTITFTVSSGYVVTLPGVYTAKAKNSLGNYSDVVTFTRDEGEISISAIYAVSGKERTKLSASAYSTIRDGERKTEYHYFVTKDYFTYIDTILGEPISNEIGEIDPSLITINKNAEKYLDVKVNSNLNLVAEIIELNPEGYGNYDYEHIIVYKISTTSDGDETPFVYRYLVVHFLSDDNNLMSTSVVDVGSTTEKVIENGVVQSVSTNGVKVTFTQVKTDGTILGNTLFIDRYYNGEFVETIVLNTILENVDISYTFIITTVGLHQFAVRDLAGRQHKFSTAVQGQTQTNLNILSVYLINQVLFSVNDNTSPINNQVFNDGINIKVISKINDLTLYNTSSLSIVVYKNGSPIVLPIENGVINISEQGFYIVEFVAITQLSSVYVSNQEVTSTYSFVIVRDDIARNSFNVSKGTNFAIEKVLKTIAGETYDVTEDFISSPNGNLESSSNYTSSLLWLSYSEQQKSKFVISLKSYNVAMDRYDTFTFNVWINDTKPTIHSNVTAGEQTRDTIELYFNAGLIYEEVGVCRIEINGTTYVDIDKDSETVVTTITLSNAGEYSIKIVSDDGTVLSSYKFIKVDPLNNTTKFIIVIAVIAVVAVVVLFFLIRKKGKYR